MNVTVIVCTHNRSEVLAKALESMAASVVPAGVAWEVLVVDNNSTDQTRDVVEEFSARYPGRFRYLFEPQPGKSHALNAGVREARGDVLVFTDDDCTAEPTWLHNLTTTLEDDKWIGAGGRIFTTNTFRHPRWFTLKGPHGLGGVLCGFFDPGDKPCELSLPPHGGNMAYRKSAFEKYGGFRTDIGPSPDRKIPRPNEDTEFGRRLMAAGERVRYEPSAVVYHPAFEERLNKEYFLTWWFDFGRAQIREVGRKPDIWGVPRGYFTIAKITAQVLTISVFRWLLTVDSAERFFNKCLVWKAFGNIAEIWSQSHKATAANIAISE